MNIEDVEKKIEDNEIQFKHLDEQEIQIVQRLEQIRAAKQQSIGRQGALQELRSQFKEELQPEVESEEANSNDDN